MKAKGWWREPESNKEIDEAIRWYLKIMKWRVFQPNTNIPQPISIRELKDLYEVYESVLDIDYLSDLISAIDDSFISEKVKSHNKAAE